MTPQEIKDRAAYLAADLRPAGKKNIEGWEEYAIAVALKLVEEVNPTLKVS